MIAAERYAADVISGRVNACKWIKLAAERHLRDLETGEDRGLWFDPVSAAMVLAFFSCLKHIKGRWAGETVKLEPWQQFHLWVLFGWKRADGTRRFRTSYLEVARKNGKSTLASGVGLFLLLGDGEPGAEVFTAATKKDQAAIVHKISINMVKRSPDLSRELTVYKNLISYEPSASTFIPLGADSTTLDGLNVHGGICDELHAWRDGSLYDVLETGTGSRDQPLMYSITTAGDSISSFCYQMHEYSEKVLSGVINDDSFFAMIYSLDALEESDDPEQWIKANPNLGISKHLDGMVEKWTKASNMPARQNAFLQKELNWWVTSVAKWLDVSLWKAGGGFPWPDEGLSWEKDSIEILRRYEIFLSGRRCCAGLDLSSISDISAEVLVFEPDKDGIYWVLPRFWIPKDNIQDRVSRDRVPYDTWERMGLLSTTEGNVIDYGFILGKVDDDASDFDVLDIGFDRWGATKVIQDMQDIGGEDWVVEFGQGFMSMSPPMRELERLIRLKKIGHINHPVLLWMIDNVVARYDPAGNVKPDKQRSREKIDGVVSLIMGLDRMQKNEKKKKKSVYATRGIVSVGKVKGEGRDDEKGGHEKDIT